MTISGIQLPKEISIGPAIVAPNTPVILAYTKAVRDGKVEAQQILARGKK
jgi:hypothetical protein